MAARRSAETEDYTNFRTRLFLDTVIPTFLFPPLLTLAVEHAIQSRTALQLGGVVKLLMCLTSIPVSLFARIQVRRWTQDREALRLGAQIVPRIRGKWPGNLDVLLRVMRSPKDAYIMDSARKLMETMGSNTVNTNILWVDQFLTMDEGFVKCILATGFDHFDKGVDQKEKMEDLLGNGIFNRDGEIWKKHRLTARPFFVRERITDFDHFEKFSRKTLDVLSRFDSSQPIDVQDLFARFTLDTASAFLFNTNLDTLSLPLPQAYKAKLGPKGSAIEGDFGSFATAFEEAQQILSRRGRQRMFWKLSEFFGNASDPSMKAIREYLDPLVKHALKEKEQYKAMDKSEAAESADSFLRYLAMSTDDVTMIREELLNILLASRDTTASLLTSTVYFFAQHPDVLARLRSEILSVCPPGQVPTYDDIRNLKYLRAVLNETLRLFPPVPANSRTSRDAGVAVPISVPSADGEMKSVGSIYVPSNTNIVYFPILIHKRKDLWGPDADVFDPDRWLNDGTGRLDRMIKNPLMFVPFNAGPRICLGQQFALNEASFFLVLLLQVYDKFELALDAQPEGSLPPAHWADVKDSRASVDKVWFQSSVTLYIKGGLWVNFHRAE